MRILLAVHPTPVANVPIIRGDGKAPGSTTMPDLARASELFEESLALYRGLGDDTGVAAVLAELGQVARAQGTTSAPRC